MNTSATPLEDSLKLLETEHGSSVARLSELQAEMDTRRQRVEDLERAINALRSILGVPSEVVDDKPEESSTSDGDGRTPDQQQPSDQPRTKPVRIRSTDAVVRIVAEAGQPLTREDIRTAFHEQGLVPESWKTPMNAINNAIARAAEKQRIHETRDGRFSSMREAPVADVQTPTGVLHDLAFGAADA